MPKRSAGVLLFRKSASGVEVLLGHPGGPFGAKRDDGAWSIPKGEFEEGEAPLDAAKREFEEEMGSAAAGVFIPLEPIRQSSGKTVYAWALEGDFDVAQHKSNTFQMEWPPRSGHQRDFPEVDRAAWFDIETARRKILGGQAGLLDQLLQKLAV